MSLLHEICRWSTSLKPCLRDALRRLLQNSPLTDDDFDALFALVKLEAGIPDANGRAPECLDARHLRSTAAIGTSVRPLAIRKLKHVNRITPDQTLEFAPVGLTVVCGDDGTGKSGCSRVLKSACRARGEAVRVLPNAHLPVQQQGTPEAEPVIDSFVT